MLQDGAEGARRLDASTRDIVASTRWREAALYSLNFPRTPLGKVSASA